MTITFGSATFLNMAYRGVAELIYTKHKDQIHPTQELEQVVMTHDQTPTPPSQNDHSKATPTSSDSQIFRA